MSEDEIFWPLSQGADALQALASASGLPTGGSLSSALGGASPPPSLNMLGGRLETEARSLGLELQGVTCPYGEVDTLLHRASPALLAVPGRGYLLLKASNAQDVTVLGRNLRPVRRPRAWLHELLCGAIEAPHQAAVSRLLDAAGVDGRRRSRAARLLLRERLLQQPVSAVWLLRLPAQAGLVQQLREAGLAARIGKALCAHTLDHVCGLLAFLVVGHGALSGQLDRGVLWAGLLLLLSTLPLRTLATLHEEALSTRLGVLLRRRLLSGTLALPPARLRSEGVGRLLGRVLESEALERLLSSGGLGLLMAAIELAVAALLLWQSGSVLLLVLFAGFIPLCLGLALRAHHHRATWAASHRELTQQLIESMSGHRTRLAQHPAATWHDAEDQALEGYRGKGEQADRAMVHLEPIAGRGFFLVGLLGLLPDFVLAPPNPPTSDRLGIGLWAVLLSAGALAKLVQGLQRLSDAVLAWHHVTPLLEGPVQPRAALPQASDPADPAAPRQLTAHALELRHAASGQPLLRGASLTLSPGDRVLLDGPSGAGKSTLAAVLAGLRGPDSGLLLLGGRDLATMGAEAWRKQVALAPQYHENHVLCGSFAYNLLLGRAWPPTAEGLEAAKEICAELGLEPLLSRMPAGLHQMLGETGWQLSQGERSRLFLARALLQDADVVILDESVAALDPETLVQVMRCVWRRARSLLAIVHP